MRNYTDEELRERLWTISERGFLTRGPWCGVPRAYAEEISRIEDAEWNLAIEAAASSVAGSFPTRDDPAHALMQIVADKVRQLRRPE